MAYACGLVTPKQAADDFLLLVDCRVVEEIGVHQCNSHHKQQQQSRLCAAISDSCQTAAAFEQHASQPTPVPAACEEQPLVYQQEDCISDTQRSEEDAILSYEEQVPRSALKHVYAYQSSCIPFIVFFCSAGGTDQTQQGGDDQPWPWTWRHLQHSRASQEASQEAKSR